MNVASFYGTPTIQATIRSSAGRWAGKVFVNSEMTFGKSSSSEAIKSLRMSFNNSGFRLLLS
jgi:hypothetical protein